MKAVWGVVVGFGLLMSVAAATAQNPFTGMGMLRSCEQAERLMAAPSGTPSGANIREASTCLGYLVGIRHGVRIGEVIGSGSVDPKWFCIPDSVTHEQLMRITLSWLRNNPKMLHEDAGFLVATSYRDAFPCPR